MCVCAWRGREAERERESGVLFLKPRESAERRNSRVKGNVECSHIGLVILPLVLLVCLLFSHSCLGGVVVSFLPLQNGRARDSARARGTSL